MFGRILLLFCLLVYSESQATRRVPSIYLELEETESCTKALSDEYPSRKIPSESIWGVFPDDRPRVIALWNLLVHLERKGALSFTRQLQRPFRILNMMAGDGSENPALVSFFSSGEFLTWGDPVSLDSLEPDFDKHFKGQALQAYLQRVRASSDPSMAAILGAMRFYLRDPVIARTYVGLFPDYEFIFMNGVTFRPSTGDTPAWEQIIFQAARRLAPDGRLLIVYPDLSESHAILQSLEKPGIKIISQGIALQSGSAVEHYFLGKAFSPPGSPQPPTPTARP
jgi:hypothetical protein